MVRRLGLSALVALGSALLGAGCSSEGPSDGGVDASAAVDLDLPDLSRPDRDALDPCTDRFSTTDGSVCILSVEGTLVDEAGTPLPNVQVTVCGEACFFAKSSATGRFSIDTRSYLDPAFYSLHLDGRPDRVNLYAPFPPVQAGVVTFPTPVPLPALPSTGPELRRDQMAQVATSGDVTLDIPTATQVELNILDFALLPEGAQLRAVRVAPGLALPFGSPARQPLDAWGLAPFEVEFSRKVAVTLPNRLGLAAGSPVELWQQRPFILTSLPAGVLELAARAHVSADGQTIRTDSGEGLSTLTWIVLFTP